MGKNTQVRGAPEQRAQEGSGHTIHIRVDLPEARSPAFHARLWGQRRDLLSVGNSIGAATKCCPVLGCPADTVQMLCRGERRQRPHSQRGRQPQGPSLRNQSLGTGPELQPASGPCLRALEGPRWKTSSRPPARPLPRSDVNKSRMFPEAGKVRARRCCFLHVLFQAPLALLPSPAWVPVLPPRGRLALNLDGASATVPVVRFPPAGAQSPRERRAGSPARLRSLPSPSEP